MSCNAGPAAIKDSLVLSLDATNIKSTPYSLQSNDHGIADWYCFVTATVTYSCSLPYTTIYQVTNTGVISAVLTTGANPQQGTFTITAGYKYYGNKPIFLTAEDNQHCIAPLTMADQLFIYIANRATYEAGTIYFYAPYASATVTMYKGGTGITGTAVSTISLSRGQQGTFSTTALDWYYFTSTSPVIGTAKQTYTDLVTTADKTILSPAKLTSYQRFPSYNITSIGGVPTVAGSYVVYDTTYPVITMNIADGSGGDCAQGLAYEYLCDRYSWGNVLSDYVIVAPYPDTVASTYYWNGSTWVVWETHVMSGGSKYVPNVVMRDGTTGPGVWSAFTIGGVAANMANGATLWKWESNNPIYLSINDSQDDELSLLGWMNARSARNTTWIDLTGTANNGTLQNGPVLSTDGIMFTAGLYQYADFVSSSSLQFLGTAAYTLEAWVYPTVNPGANNWTGIFDRESTISVGRDGYNLYFLGSATTATYFVSDRWAANSGVFPTVSVDSSQSVNAWQHIVAVYDGSTISVYRNGVLGQGVSSTGAITNTVATLKIGNRGGNYFTGKIAEAKIYNRALTAAEVLQNFSALRSRFGI